MAIRIGHMKITFIPRGILWAVWIKALFHEVCPETVNIRNVKNQPPPLDTSIAVFEVQNRIPVFWADRRPFHQQRARESPIARRAEDGCPPRQRQRSRD